MLGTEHAVALANEIKAGLFHHMSSIAVAGNYEGVFREDMFDEAKDYLDHPYMQTKHESEAYVREHRTMPWRAYRPAIVLGDSKTGEIDKIDGPYYFFKLLQRMRSMLPPWMPTIGIEGGRVNMVPGGLCRRCHRSHRAQRRQGAQQTRLPSDRSGAAAHRRFAQHLRPCRARAADDDAHQRRAVWLHSAERDEGHDGIAASPSHQERGDEKKRSGIPDDVLGFINYPVRFDCRDTLKALEAPRSPCRNSTPMRPPSCGITGSATSTPISLSIAR